MLSNADRMYHTDIIATEKHFANLRHLIVFRVHLASVAEYHIHILIVPQQRTFDAQLGVMDEPYPHPLTVLNELVNDIRRPHQQLGGARRRTCRRGGGHANSISVYTYTRKSFNARRSGVNKYCYVRLHVCGVCLRVFFGNPSLSRSLQHIFIIYRKRSAHTCCYTETKKKGGEEIERILFSIV